MSLEKAIQKLTNAITAAKMPGIFPEPSIIPGLKRLGDCPVGPGGGLDWKKLPKGACCYNSTSEGCVRTCGGQGPGFTLVSEQPCPQDGVFTGDDSYRSLEQFNSNR